MTNPISSKFPNADLVLFDLDDTLYREIDFLRKAYARISNLASATCESSAETIYTWMENEFSERGRDLLFQKLCRKFSIPEPEIQEWLKVLRSLEIREGLRLKNWVAPFIDEHDGRFAVVTNGNVAQQRNKISLLRLNYLFPDLPIYYAALTKPKPHSNSFRIISRDFNVSPENVVMVGDSDVDEKYAQECGIHFVSVEVLESHFG